MATRRIPADRRAHKIDSTLRGNWATELVGLQRASGGPVLIVPAFPTAGRVCRNGVVFADGRPVADGAAGRDPIAPIRHSRPATILREAGAERVADCPDPGAAAAALAAGKIAFLVCDAATDDDLLRYAELWADRPTVLLAGTAAVIGAAARALAPPIDAPPDRGDLTPTGGRQADVGPVWASTALPIGQQGAAAAAEDAAPRIGWPTVVVCASLHPAARAQIDELARRGWPVRATLATGETLDRQLVLATPSERHPTAGVGPLVELAEVARRLIRGAHVATLVLVGGDTAAAVLDDTPLWVGGTLAPGVPWCRATVDGPLILTKPGGFGGATLLADLLDPA